MQKSRHRLIQAEAGETQPEEQIRAQRIQVLSQYPVGDGLSEIFKGIGTDYLIEGGQTMNPSTEDMLNAIAACKCKDHLHLPKQ